MPDYRSRQELRDGILQAFSAREEIYRITIFGKEAVGRNDDFSDIDLIVYSNDIHTTWRDYRQLFSSVAPVTGTFSLGSGSDWFAESLILSGYSPYHKIDFSIGLGLDPALMTEMTVYDCPQKQAESVSSLALEEDPLDLSFHLANQLFAVPRFLKCIFRGDIDMYRRWTGMLNAVLVLWYERKFGWEVNTRRTKLMSYEVDRLTRELSAVEREQLNAICPMDGNVQLATSYRNGFDAYIDLAREKAADIGVVLNENLIDYVQTFMDGEYLRLNGK